MKTRSRKFALVQDGLYFYVVDAFDNYAPPQDYVGLFPTRKTALKRAQILTKNYIETMNKYLKYYRQEMRK